MNSDGVRMAAWPKPKKRVKTMKFKAEFADGRDSFVIVRARNINAGMKKALADVLDTCDEELHSISFWMVLD